MDNKGKNGLMRALTLFWFSFLLNPAQGTPLAPSPVLLSSEETSTQAIIEKSLLFEDKSKGISFGENPTLLQARQALQKYTVLRQPRQVVGYGGSRVWLMFDLINDWPESDFMIRYSYASMQSLELFLFDQTGALLLRKISGKLVPPNERPINDIEYLFPVKLEKGTRYTVLMRFESSGSIQLPVTILTLGKTHREMQSRYLLYGLYYGAVGLILVYTFSLCLSSFNALFVSYFLYVLSTLVLQMSLYGVGYKYFWPNFPVWNKISTLFILGQMFTCLSAFTAVALETRKTPRLHRVLYGFGITSQLFSLLVVFFYGSTLITIAGIPTSLLPVIFAVIGVVAVRKGARFAPYFLSGTICYIVGGCIYSLKDAGILPSVFITEYGVLVGSFGEIFLFSVGIAIHLRHIQTNAERLKRELNVAQALGNLASQVAHDIRSPLAALAVIGSDLGRLPEEQRVLLRSAISRIQDIANHLLDRYRRRLLQKNPMDPVRSVELISTVLDDIITEKRLEFRSRLGLNIQLDLDSASYGLFSSIDAIEFGRIVSNLVNNSVEAIPEKGSVRTSVRKSVLNPDFIEVCIVDNGSGIPEEVKATLGLVKGISKKKNGAGLGLYHARAALIRWGGSLEIKSEGNKGTTVMLSLPQAPTPAWFLSEITLEPATQIMVLDDDDSIHHFWDSRFGVLRASGENLSVYHFFSLEKLEVALKARGASLHSKICLLIDYELLGSHANGLDFIERNKIVSNSILVTSHYDEVLIRERCVRLGVRLIPKGLAGFVKISMKKEANRLEAVT